MLLFYAAAVPAAVCVAGGVAVLAAVHVAVAVAHPAAVAAAVIVAGDGGVVIYLFFFSLFSSSFLFRGVSCLVHAFCCSVCIFLFCLCFVISVIHKDVAFFVFVSFVFSPVKEFFYSFLILSLFSSLCMSGCSECCMQH